jgi:glyoxylase-like metal-dependent hydrolase (beta-lactamase superfamily II)
VRVYHINCGSMCPRGRRLLAGEGGWLETADVVCHCLLIETDDGLVLIDTGFGVDDVRDLGRLGPVYKLMRPQARVEETAVKQVEALGFEAGDVRRIVATHLDPDHSGGLPDFPDAEVHVFAPELEAALEPSLRDRPRYARSHWAHGVDWVRHEVEGDDWFGFEGVRILPGTGAEMLLVPLAGHTKGHSGIALKTGEGWLLHCGDAYFHHGELSTPPNCPPGLSFFQNLNNADRKQRLANRERLRELAGRHGDEIAFVCSHDPHELEREQARAAAAVPTGE